MGSTDENFTFSLALKNGDAAYTETLSATKTTSAGTSETTTLPVSDGKYTFTLKNGESINISIPYGYTYEVSEDAKAADDGYTTEIAVNGDGAEIEDADTPTAGGDLKEATTVTFTNTKNVHAPTGLSGGSDSWMILLGAAAVFAVTSGLYGLRRKKVGAHD